MRVFNLGVLAVALIVLAILIVWLSTAWMAFEKSLATLSEISISALSPSELPSVGRYKRLGQNKPGPLKFTEPAGETATHQLEKEVKYGVSNSIRWAMDGNPLHARIHLKQFRAIVFDLPRSIGSRP